MAWQLAVWQMLDVVVKDVRAVRSAGADNALLAASKTLQRSEHVLAFLLLS